MNPNIVSPLPQTVPVMVNYPPMMRYGTYGDFQLHHSHMIRNSLVTYEMVYVIDFSYE